MHLGIDAREIQDGVFTGIGRPLVDLIRYFSETCHEDTCLLFSERPIPVTFGANVKNIVMPARQTQYWDQLELPGALRRESVDVFYSPYYKIPLIKPCPTVSAVLDLMYLTFEPYRRDMPVWKLAYYRTAGRLFAHRADRVMTCSQHSKKEIMKTYGVSSDKIDVIPLSVSPGFHPEESAEKINAMKARLGITGRYLLYVGNFKVHKNVQALVVAFSRLSAAEEDLQLVLAGPREHTYSDLVSLVEQLELTDRVIFTGTLTEDDEPRVLYSGAEVFVMPSLYEGFGLPPAEAMACGVPVVASNATSIPEVVQDAGILIDAMDPDAMAEVIRNLLNSPRQREDLIDKGRMIVKEYDPRHVARRMMELFHRTARQV